MRPPTARAVLLPCLMLLALLDAWQHPAFAIRHISGHIALEHAGDRERTLKIGHASRLRSLERPMGDVVSWLLTAVLIVACAAGGVPQSAAVARDMSTARPPSIWTLATAGGSLPGARRRRPLHRPSNRDGRPVSRRYSRTPYLGFAPVVSGRGRAVDRTRRATAAPSRCGSAASVRAAKAATRIAA